MRSDLAGCARPAVFLDQTSVLDLFLSGFRSEFGTETALLALVDYLCLQLDKDNASLLIQLDLSAASDTVIYVVWWISCNQFELKGTALHWFDSFLVSRKQRRQVK